MKYKTIASALIIVCTLLTMLMGCESSSPSKYIPQAMDTVKCDKNNLGLNGRVKTMDIYYYRPENASTIFSTKFKKGEKWEEDGIHHYHLSFNKDGNFTQYIEYNLSGMPIRKTEYVYEPWGYTRTESRGNANYAIISKYNARGQLLETMHHYANNHSNDHGEINTYDDRGNLISTEQTDGAAFKPALIEYDYNDENQMTEKREYYNKGELSAKTLYTHDADNLLTRAEKYEYLHRQTPKTSILYEYSDSNRIVEEYQLGPDGNKELIAWCKHVYHPNGRLKTVIRNSFVEEEYDEQGRRVNKTPGFEILCEDYRNYEYDDKGNWVRTKNFKDYVDFGTGLGRIVKPYVERSFTYYED